MSRKIHPSVTINRTASVSPDAWLYYSGTDICVPDDDDFREWLDAIPNHQGTGKDCQAVLHLSFDSATELEGWENLGPDPNVSVAQGLLWPSSNEAEGFAAVARFDHFDPPLKDWTAASISVHDTLSRAAMWVALDDPRYQVVALDWGSGLHLQSGESTINTNWRFFVWDNDHNGPGDRAWLYFNGYGYGYSDMIRSGLEEGNALYMSLSFHGDSLRIEMEGEKREVLFADRLLTRLRDAGATEAAGAALAFHPTEDWGQAVFDSFFLIGDRAAARSRTRRPNIRDAAMVTRVRPLPVRRQRP